MQLAKDKELKRYFFRKLFINEKDAEIAGNVSNFFNAVKERWPVAWEGGHEGDILNKSTSLVAFFRFLSDAYLFLYRRPGTTDIDYSRIGTVFSSIQYKSIFDLMNVADNEFTSENFDPGGSGRSQLYKRLLNESQINNNN